MKTNWRDSFLIERGKMTTDRYNKIRNSLPPVKFVIFLAMQLKNIYLNSKLYHNTQISIGFGVKYGICFVSVK